jgi:hypothetical protein
MPGFIDHLKAEIQELERLLEADPRFVKLRELRRIQHLYETERRLATETDSPSDALRSPRRPATREITPETKLVMEEAEKFLAGQIRPIPLRDMYHEIVEVRGCHIGGKDPINGLSAILSRSPQFVSHGRSGWTLAEKEEASQTETPNSGELFGAPKSNGAMPLSP